MGPTTPDIHIVFHSLLSQLITGTSIIVCGAALILGSSRERMGALYYAIAFIGAALLFIVGWPSPAWRSFLINAFALIGFTTLCWKSPHPWVLWASGFQLLASVTTIYGLIHAGTLRWTMLTITNGCSYFVLLSLFVGTLAAFRRKQRDRNQPPT